MSFVLTPTGLGSEHLNVVRLARGFGAADSIMLGRNEVTGLNSPNYPNFQFISRRHVEFSSRGYDLYMKCVSTQDNVVYLNGAICGRAEVRLVPGDLVSFLGVKSYYNYIVSIDSITTTPTRTTSAAPVVVDLLGSAEMNRSNLNGNPLNTTKVLPPVSRTQSVGNENSTSATNGKDASFEILPAPSKAETKNTTSQLLSPSTVAKQAEQAAMKNVVKKLLMQYECSICLDTLAAAVSLSPCGCCFCYACVADWVDGPNGKASKGTGSSSSGSPSDLHTSANCPQCNVEFAISAVLPSRVIDNAIREVLQTLPEDLKAWEERVNAGNERRKQALNSAKNASTAAASGRSFGSSGAFTFGAASSAVPLGDQPFAFGARSVFPTFGAVPTYPNHGSSSGGDMHTGIRFGAAAPSVRTAAAALAPPVVVDLQDSQAPGYGLPTAAAASTSRGRRTAGSPEGRAHKRARNAAAAGAIHDLTSQAGGLGNPFDTLAAPAPAARPTSASCFYGVMALSLLQGRSCHYCYAPLIGKIAVGVVHRPRAGETDVAKMAIVGGYANTGHWRSACKEWYHPLCLIDLMGHDRPTRNQLQLMDVLTKAEKAEVTLCFN